MGMTMAEGERGASEEDAPELLAALLLTALLLPALLLTALLLTPRLLLNGLLLKTGAMTHVVMLDGAVSSPRPMTAGAKADGSSTSHDDDAVSLGHTQDEERPEALIQQRPPLPHVLVAQGVVPDDPVAANRGVRKRERRRRRRRRGRERGGEEERRGKGWGGEKEEVERMRLLMMATEEGGARARRWTGSSHVEHLRLRRHLDRSDMEEGGTTARERGRAGRWRKGGEANGE